MKRPGIVVQVLAYALGAILVPHAGAQTIVWSGGGTSGLWTDPLNWTPARVPDAADDVSIPAGSPTIRLSTSQNHTIQSLTSGRHVRVVAGSLRVTGAASLASFAIDGGTAIFDGPTTASGLFTMSRGTLDGPGDLTLNSGLRWTMGDAFGTGRLILGGTSTIVGNTNPNAWFAPTRPVEVMGTLNVEGESMVVAGGANFTITPTGIVNLNGTVDSASSIGATGTNALLIVLGQLNGMGLGDQGAGPRVVTRAGSIIRAVRGNTNIVLFGDQLGTIDAAETASLSLTNQAIWPSAGNFLPGSQLTGSGASIALSNCIFAPGTLNTTGLFWVSGGTVELHGPIVDRPVLVDGGTLILYGDHLWTTCTLGTQSGRGGRLLIEGNLTILQDAAVRQGILTGSGRLTLAPGCLTHIEGAEPSPFYVSTDHFGTLNGDLHASGSAIVTNKAGATIHGAITTDTNAMVINEGLVRIENRPGAVVRVLNRPTGEVLATGGALLYLGWPADQRGRISSDQDIFLYGDRASTSYLVGEGLQLSAQRRVYLISGTYTISPLIQLSSPEIEIAQGVLRIDRNLGVPSIVASGQPTRGIVHVLTDTELQSFRFGFYGELRCDANLRIASSANLSGPIGGTGTLFLGPQCTALTSGGFYGYSCSIENAGQWTVQPGGLTLSNATLTNAPSGRIILDNSNNQQASLLLNGSALLRNNGLLTTRATAGTGIASVEVPVDQRGVASCAAGTLRFTNSVSQVSADVLSGGSWIASGTGAISLPSNPAIRSLAQSANVTLDGPSAQLPWLSSGLRSIAGSLTLLGGRDLALSPQGSSGAPTLHNSGHLVLGPASDLTISGAYAQTTEGALQVTYASMPASARVAATTAALDGALGATFDAGFHPSPIQPVPLVTASDLAGRFARASIPATRAVSYTSGSAALVGRCPADLDDGTGSGLPDGGITIDDLLFYLNAYSNGSLAADLDDGTGEGTPDGGVTIDDLLYFLTRYSAGC